MKRAINIRKTSIVPICLILLALFSLSFAFADVNGGTAIQRNGAGVGNNYIWGGNVDTQLNSGLYNHFTTFQGSLGNNAPVVCDIDKDGRQDIIVNDGNLIQVWSKNEQNILYVAESFSIRSYNNATQQINSIACSKLLGDLEDDYILIVHQGENAHIGSSTTYTNNLLFIEFQTENTIIPIPFVNETYGDNYTLIAGATNVSDIVGGEIVCDGYRLTLGDPETRAYCMYATHGSFTTFSLPDKADDFNGTQEVRNWDIDDGLSIRALRTFPEAQTNNRQPEQSYAIAYYKESQKLYAHLVTSGAGAGRDVWEIDGNNAIYQTTLTTPGTAGKMQLMDIQSTDDRNDDRVCFSFSSDFTGASLGTTTMNCATGNGAVFPLSSEGQNGGNRKIFISAYGRYDYNRDGTNNRLSFAVNDQLADKWLPGWAGWISSTLISTASYDTSQPATTGMPFQFFASHYEQAVNDTILIVGNELTRFRLNNASYELIGTFPHSKNVELRALDLDDDFKLELLARDTITGEVFVYIQESDLVPGIDTINLINTTILGDGYYGWYNNSQCSTDNVTFEAKECLEGATDCTYISDSFISQERLCSTCGGTVPFSCGDYSFTTPSLDCALSDGDYNVTLSIESTQDLGNYQATNFPPIPINVITGEVGVACNIVGQQLNEPSEDIVIDPGEGEPPVVIDPTQPTADPDEQPVVYMFQLLFGNIPPALKLILTIIIVLGLAIFTHNRTGGNQLMVSIAGALGVGLAVILTLLSIEVALIGVVIFVLVAVVMHKFNNPVLNGGI